MDLIQMQSMSATQKSIIAWEVKKGNNADKPTVAKALERMATATKAQLSSRCSNRNYVESAHDSLSPPLSSLESEFRFSMLCIRSCILTLCLVWHHIFIGQMIFHVAILSDIEILFS
jgi:hypothetical protein